MSELDRRVRRGLAGCSGTDCVSLKSVKPEVGLPNADGSITILRGFSWLTVLLTGGRSMVSNMVSGGAACSKFSIISVRFLDAVGQQPSLVGASAENLAHQQLK
jgi:hypothetical protein